MSPALVIRPARVEGRLRAPPSKSHTHRAFILAALSGNGLVRHPLIADDTEATLAGLHAMGFQNTQESEGTRVGGVLRPSKRSAPARESGTTLRLLLPIAALAPVATTFDLGARLRERPIEPLLNALRALGAKAERSPDGAQLRVSGPIRGGECDVPGEESSQYVSGLLLASPVADGETRIRVRGALASRPYVDLTLALMRDRGARVSEEDGTFIVPGSQRYRQKTYDVPGDWSSAAFLFGAAAVTNGSVNVEGLPLNETEGDARILQHLDALGCCVEASEKYVSVAGCKPEGASIDVGATPDLFPVLAAVGAIAKGETLLHGAAHLRHKESDRIHAMATNLRKFGVGCEERPDGLVVRSARPVGTTIESFNDHRIAMACAVLALAAKGETTLPDPDVVRKSYPGFAQDLGRIIPGGLP